MALPEPETLTTAAEAFHRASIVDGSLMKVVGVEVDASDKVIVTVVVLGSVAVGASTVSVPGVRLQLGRDTELRTQDDVIPTVLDVLVCRVDDEEDCLVFAVEPNTEDKGISRKLIAYPNELLAFMEDQASLRNNDVSAMVREAVFQWARDNGYHRWLRRRHRRHRRFRKLKTAAPDADPWVDEHGTPCDPPGDDA